MTYDRYIEMCEQLGKEPIEHEIPVAWEDLPDVAHVAISVYSRLGDRIESNIGFVGKDYTCLPILLEVYGVDDKELILEIIHWLEARQIKKSSEAMKEEHKKLKRKAGGTKRSYP